MSHTVSGDTTSYTWDIAAALPSVIQHNLLGTTSSYIYGVDLISWHTSSAQRFYLYDGLGSVTALTSTSGSVTASYTYGAFGIQGMDSISANYFKYTGEQKDADSGLYYLRARYYDPGTGRFLSQDPLPAGNLYAYVANNPVNRIDPTGERWMTDKEGGSFYPCGLGAPSIAADTVAEAPPGFTPRDPRGSAQAIYFREADPEGFCSGYYNDLIHVCSVYQSQGWACVQWNDDGYSHRCISGANGPFLCDPPTAVADHTTEGNWILCGGGAVASGAGLAGLVFITSTGAGATLLPTLWTVTSALGSGTVRACIAAID